MATNGVPSTSAFDKEVRSESTLPLLNFLLSASPGQSSAQLADVLHQVTADIGQQDPPLPDESEELKEVLLKLMKDGPGKPDWTPKVSALSQNVRMCADLSR